MEQTVFIYLIIQSAPKTQTFQQSTQEDKYMKKYVLYPLLFSVNPILLLLAANISDLPLSQLFPVILITPLVADGLLWLLNMWLKNIHRAGFIVFLTILWFFHYGTVHLWANIIHIGPISLGNHWIFFPLWTLIFILFSSGFLWHKITSPETITMFLNLVCIFVVAFSILRISLDLVPRYLTRQDLSQALQSLPEPTSSSNLPDVYYIILDGYARGDVLEELYKFDNLPFLQALEERGFYIASQSQSNYMQTALSLASSLNMEYLSDLPTSAPDRGQLIGMIRQSRVQSIFEHLGYKIVAISTGYQPTDLTNANYYFSSPHLGKAHDLEALLMINSITVILIEQGWINVPISRFRVVQERINYTFDTLANEVPLLNGPKLVFTHIIAPHPPFIFDQNGSISPNEFYILTDGDRFSGGREIYTQEYVDQLIYINDQLLRMIDGILANSINPPVIILQADHGPGAYLDWKSVENTCLKERFSILNAYYLPQGGSSQLNQHITPVNSFRVLFNYFFGTNFEFMDDKEYFSTWDNPYNFVDVTDKSQLPCDIR